MKKKILIVSTIVALVVILAIVGFWYMSTQPLYYRPGMVRQAHTLRAPLAPPGQGDDPDFWQVEADIRLYHFAQGDGRNVLIIHGGPGMPFRQVMSGLER